jgi:hypothetical protein
MTLSEPLEAFGRRLAERDQPREWKDEAPATRYLPWGWVGCPPGTSMSLLDGIAQARTK